MNKLLVAFAVLLTSSAFAQPAALYTEEFIVPPGTYSNNHASILEEVAPGELLACWFAGKKEAGRDVEIVCSRKKGVGPWSPPVVAVGPGERPKGSWWRNKFVGNPVLMKDDDGVLWLFYEAVAVGGHSGAYVDYKTSRDQGRTWSRSVRLQGYFGNFGRLPRNKALRMGPNRFWLPLYREFTRKYGYVLELRIRRGKITSSSRIWIPGTDHIQPTLVKVKGKVLTYLRNTDGNRILVSTYQKDANRFAPVRPLALPNPNAAVAAANDSKGNVLLVFNNSTRTRTPLSLGFSSTGMAFKTVHDFENDPEGSFSYPCLIRDEEGLYHLSYTFNRTTIKYVRFNEEWLRSRR